jgi:prolyl-tRNA synthetase
MVHGDEAGLVLPPRIAPRQVVIIPIGESEEVKKLTDETLAKLQAAGIIAYVDNSEKSPGFKFAEAEVNGIPVRIEVGARDLANNQITVARRDTREKLTTDADTDIVKCVSELLETIQKDMYNRAVERRDKLTFEAHNLSEIENILNTQPGFIHAMWCGNPECEAKIKEIKGCKSRCIVDEEAIDTKCVCCGEPAKHHVIWGIQY